MTDLFRTSEILTNGQQEIYSFIEDFLSQKDSQEVSKPYNYTNAFNIDQLYSEYSKYSEHPEVTQISPEVRALKTLKQEIGFKSLNEIIDSYVSIQTSDFKNKSEFYEVINYRFNVILVDRLLETEDIIKVGNENEFLKEYMFNISNYCDQKRASNETGWTDSNSIKYFAMELVEDGLDSSLRDYAREFKSTFIAEEKDIWTEVDDSMIVRDPVLSKQHDTHNIIGGKVFLGNSCDLDETFRKYTQVTDDMILGCADETLSENILGPANETLSENYVVIEFDESDFDESDFEEIIELTEEVTGDAGTLDNTTWQTIPVWQIRLPRTNPILKEIHTYDYISLSGNNHVIIAPNEMSPLFDSKAQLERYGVLDEKITSRNYVADYVADRNSEQAILETSDSVFDDVLVEEKTQASHHLTVEDFVLEDSKFDEFDELEDNAGPTNYPVLTKENDKVLESVCGESVPVKSSIDKISDFLDDILAGNSEIIDGCRVYQIPRENKQHFGGIEDRYAA